MVAAKPPPLAVSEACALVVREDRLLIVRRKAEGLWAGFWEFPTINLDGADPARRSFGEPVGLAEGVERLTGIRARIGPEVKRLNYSVTKHRVELRVHLGEAPVRRTEARPGALGGALGPSLGPLRAHLRLGLATPVGLDRPRPGSIEVGLKSSRRSPPCEPRPRRGGIGTRRIMHKRRACRITLTMRTGRDNACRAALLGAEAYSRMNGG